MSSVTKNFKDSHSPALDHISLKFFEKEIVWYIDWFFLDLFFTQFNWS